MFIKPISYNKQYTPTSLFFASVLAITSLNGCQTTTGMQQTGSSNHPSATQQVNQKHDQTTHSNNEPRQIPWSPVQTNTQATSESNTVSDNPYSSSDSVTATAEGSIDNQVIILDNNNEEDNVDFNTSSATNNSDDFQSETPAPNDLDETNNNLPIATKPTPSAPKSIQQILIEQARQNSSRPRTSSTASNNGDNIPAFRRLMNTGISQLKQGQYSAAQGTFTRAQRLAPQSSAVYFYLGQVALKRNQYLKAEAMARRGLVVANTASRKKSLWQLILKSAQLQGNQRVIEEAQSALSR